MCPPVLASENDQFHKTGCFQLLPGRPKFSLSYNDQNNACNGVKSILFGERYMPHGFWSSTTQADFPCLHLNMYTVTFVYCPSAIHGFVYLMISFQYRRNEGCTRCMVLLLGAPIFLYCAPGKCTYIITMRKYKTVCPGTCSFKNPLPRVYMENKSLI